MLRRAAEGVRRVWAGVRAAGLEPGEGLLRRAAEGLRRVPGLQTVVTERVLYGGILAANIVRHMQRADDGRRRSHQGSTLGPIGALRLERGTTQGR